MKKLNITIQEPYFSSIKNGFKRVEGRLAKQKFVDLQVGDILVINDNLEKTVVKVTIYKTFEDMIIMEGVTNVVPDAKNLNDAIQIYYEFYSPEDEKNCGVCAIGFE